MQERASVGKGDGNYAHGTLVGAAKLVRRPPKATGKWRRREADDTTPATADEGAKCFTGETATKYESRAEQPRNSVNVSRYTRAREVDQNEHDGIFGRRPLRGFAALYLHCYSQDFSAVDSNSTAVSPMQHSSPSLAVAAVISSASCRRRLPAAFGERRMSFAADEVQSLMCLCWFSLL